MNEEFESKTGVYYGDMVNQDTVDAVQEAKAAARDVRAMHNKLSRVERGMAAKEIAVIQRLVEAVEKL
ncbi:hypothetical protein BLA13014_00412 [Burkholderia aenigmatica]|uniref:Uncharacterized protein n=1 Tax=Burkholderia aenigmatica TaxID=2015348 RepID=A0A6P2HC09_9BURK|nr:MULTISPECIES: hypothetical protein [Burkholderia]VWB15042.1 hypothetical protein BLA13014_00412 [Burkholderia aenigmatica]